MSALTQACWKLEDAREILQTEALAGDDALFLATHTPVRGFEVGGSAKDVEAPTEEGLLLALSRPDRRHAFCVVQGEPGSGKSHLIRWLSVNWPAGNDVPLLVQRANGSLEGALRQLQTQAPPQFQHLFQNLGRRQVAGLPGRANQFLLTLGATLQPDHFAKPPEDAEWCRKHDPSSLILNNQVRQHWGGPLRILKLMDGAEGARNSETASFNIDDILDLSRHCAAVADSVASQALARRIIKEAAFVREAYAEGRTFEEICAEQPDEVRASVALTNALNARRNYAVQSVIGVTAEDLKKLFEDLRIELQKLGRRVVLLLEDITSWEGLDDSLVDALVTDAQTRPDADLCPVISVVGVTPDYYAKLPGNYRQRITHDIRLGEVRGNLQDVAALRDSEARAGFVARYLCAARAGVDALKAWREDFRSQRDLPPPNPCLGCGRADACHKVFGAVDDVGLFPFTRQAVDGLFFALKNDDEGQTHQTPRGLVQGVLGPTLLHPRVLEAGAYPGPQIEPSVLERRALPGVLQGRLNNLVETPADRDRLRRLLSYWGDLRPQLVRREDGELVYAGLSQGLVAAFDLPWIADDVVESRGTVQTYTPVETPEEPEEQAPSVPPEATMDAHPKAEAVQAPPRMRAPAPVSSAKPAPRPQAPSRGQLEKLRQEINALREGETPKNISVWNSAVSDMLSRIDLRKLGVDRWTWSKIFTAENVKIAGTGAVRGPHFVVERAPWLLEGLEAYAALKTDDLSEEEAEFSKRRLAFAIRRLEALAADHLARRMPTLADGARWSPVSTAAQILLTRTWLRGAARPDAPAHEQWAAILSEEAEAASDPGSRTQPWQDGLNATNGWHDQFRRALQEMVRLPQGNAAGFGVADTAEVARAVMALIETCKLWPTPQARPGEPLPGDLEGLRAVGGRLEGLVTIPAQERKLMAGRAETMFGLLRGQATPAHILRLDKVITAVSDPMKTTLAVEVRDWKTALERQRRVLDDPAAIRVLHETMLAVTDGADELPSRLSHLLGWLAAAPAADLKALQDLAMQGEKLVAALLPHVRDLVEGAQGGADLSAIHAHGTTLQAAAARARKDLLEAGR